MEIINDNKPVRDGNASVTRPRNLFLGITLILVGVLWLLNNFDVLTDRAFDVLFSWQMLIVLIGGYLLSLRKWLSGGLVAALGFCLLLGDVLNLCIPFDKIVVPVILIGAGISVVLAHRNK